MRSVLEGTLAISWRQFCIWSTVQVRKAQQVLSRGIRRALGLDALNMREFNIADAALRRLVHWDTFEHLLQRQVLRWVGHIARMPISRLPKIALFGWPEGMTIDIVPAALPSPCESTAGQLPLTPPRPVP